MQQLSQDCTGPCHSGNPALSATPLRQDYLHFASLETKDPVGTLSCALVITMIAPAHFSCTIMPLLKQLCTFAMQLLEY
jgi:hypothetical protein